MTQTTIITTAIKTTVTLEFVTSPIIRCVARQDMPEYGLTEGQVFYMVYSKSESEAQGKNIYHIATWNYEKITWNCPCKATTAKCYHNKAISKDCAKAHTLQGYKPLSKAEKFAALRLKYDVRYVQAPALPVIQEAEQVAAQASRQQSISERLEEQRRTATLNGNRAFSILR